MIPAGFEAVGLQIGAVVVLVILGISLGLTVFGIVMALRSGRDFIDTGWTLMYGIGGLFAVIMLVVLIVGAIPFEPYRWQSYRVEATVVDISNVLTEGDGDLTRVPVVTLDADGEQFVATVDDPRIVTREGDDITLRCEIQWVYQAADRYSCVIAG